MFHGIKNLLPQSIQRAGLGRQMEAFNVLKAFSMVVEEMFSQNIAQQASPAYFKNGILTVSCLSSLIMQELQYREQEIVEKINKKAGREIVSKLRYEN